MLLSGTFAEVHFNLSRASVFLLTLVLFQAICKTISSWIQWHISAFWLPQLSRTQAVYFGSVLESSFLKLISALELYIWFALIGTDRLSHL